ncbi:MAG TPA: sulfotransferase domain-containing protein [Candidatus Paceibacterota bacterium]
MNSKGKTAYSFPSGKFFLKFRTAIITGVGRSGKTTLGNVLATHRYVEYYEEPWILNLLPAMVKLKMVNEEMGKDMFVTYLHELMNDMILLRQANFRPKDDSSIWTKKTRAEIALRLKSLQSRSDVKNFVKKHDPLFLMILREAPLFNLPAVFNFLPNCKIVHVVSRGMDVANRIQEKKWLSDKNLAKPPHARIYYPTTHQGKIFYIPSWIAPKDAKQFISSSEFERALLYWCSLMEHIMESLKQLKNKKKNILTIKFEDFLENPPKIVKSVASFLDIQPSSITKTALGKVKKHQARNPIPKLSKELLARTKKIDTYFGYGWN